MTPGSSPLDLESIRERLGTLDGRHLWRSLEELADTEEFRALLHREFPERASEWDDPVGRRRFLQLMGASLALAGLTACTSPPKDTIVPYVKQPEQLVPGRPLFFATALTLGGFATGALVTSQMGRPIKVEGNPEHPSSLGASDAFMQASTLGLYDPDRSKTVTFQGEIRPWGDFIGAIREALVAQRAQRGAGLRFLTGTVTSPTLAAQLEEILEDLPEARWHQYEPAGRNRARLGARLAFGEFLQTRYHVEEADVIVSLDADFLASGPGHLRYAREFASRRHVNAPAGDSQAGKGAVTAGVELRNPAVVGGDHDPPGVGALAGRPPMNRLYVLETTPSPTGSIADHRWALAPGAIGRFALALASAVRAPGAPPAIAPPESFGGGCGAREFEAIVRDLGKSPGRSLVVAGDQQPAWVHAAAHAINHALGNAGKTVVYTDPVEARPEDEEASLVRLAEEMEVGRVGMLVVLGQNPAYATPADLRFAERMGKVALRIHLGLYDDETAARSDWHIPEAHELESWSDARAFDGTVSILQPLIEPLYGGRTAHEVLAAFTAKPLRAAREIVREHWSTRMPGKGSFERAWIRALHDGTIAGTELPVRDLSPKGDWLGDARPEAAPGEGIEISLRPDSSVYDGRFANNGWLQELPRAMTRLTWDNPLLVSPRDAERQRLANGDLVYVSFAGRKMRAPVWILPGQAEGAATIHLGYGRTRAGRIGNGAGFDAYAIRPSAAPWGGAGARLAWTGLRHPLACTQTHQSMEGRNLVRSAPLDLFLADPGFAHHGEEEPGKDLSLYAARPYEGYAWGMAVDLGACIGCGGCALACQAENNVPIVGKEQVARGREMHWLRIDRYFEGGVDDPRILHQPVMCQQCENAPCELVCPVAATVHSSEGLNDMVYNRCVGTRYCSNNCPYKVRRFNFLQFADMKTPSLKMLYNPDVTVRTRGVMEKCTYCVQRINRARNDAEREDRKIRDGEIQTACQQACPTEAIVFGDINDPRSRVSQLKAGPRSYGLLAELGTRPRTTYLAAVRNPNPELARRERS